MSDPAWLNAGSSSGSPTPASPVSSPSASAAPRSVASGDQGGMAEGKRLAMMACTVLNLGLAFMVAANGVLAMGHKDSASDVVGIFFVGFYMLIFAVLLGAFEILQICPLQALDNPFKRNFGFLYGSVGKSLYLVL